MNDEEFFTGKPWRDAATLERAVAERNAALGRVSQLEEALRDAIGRCCNCVEWLGHTCDPCRAALTLLDAQPETE